VAVVFGFHAKQWVISVLGVVYEMKKKMPYLEIPSVCSSWNVLQIHEVLQRNSELWGKRVSCSSTR